MNAYTKGLIKSAGVVSDTLLGGIGSLPVTAIGNTALPGLGQGIATVVPFIAADYDLAKASQQQKQKHIKKMNDNRAKALIPLNGPTRLIQRQLVADADVKPLIHRNIGALTSMALPIGIGALIGSFKGQTGAAVGAGIGAGVAGMGHIIGIVAALLKRRRTLEQHRQTQKSNVAKQYLIPGYATYDYYKAVGASQNYATPEQQKQKDSKQKDDKQKDSKQSLQKQASRSYPYTADLGQGMKMQVDSQYGQRLLRRVRELRKPRSVGRSFLQSLPIAAACALVSGLGTYALNDWRHPQVAGMAAAAGGLGATLLGTLQGSMSPSMSVGDALLRAAAEQEEQKQNSDKQKQQA